MVRSAANLRLDLKESIIASTEEFKIRLMESVFTGGIDLGKYIIPEAEVRAQQICSAYDGFREAIAVYWKAKDDVMAKQRAVEVKKNEILADGSLTGANKEIREAQLEQMIATEQAEVYLAEKILRAATMKLEAAKSFVKQHRDITAALAIDDNSK